MNRDERSSAGGWQVETSSWTRSGIRAEGESDAWSESGAWSDSDSWSGEQLAGILPAEDGVLPSPDSDVWGTPSGVWSPRRLWAVRREVEAFLRRDRILQLAGLSLVLLLVLYLLPGLALPASFGLVARAGLLALVLAALLAGHSSLENLEERNLWARIGLAIVLAAVATLLLLWPAFPSGSVRGALTIDAFYVAIYLCLLLAVGARPHLGTGWRERTFGVALSRWGEISLALVLFVYFILTPLLLGGRGEGVWGPSQLFRLALDLYLTGLVFYYSAVAPTRRWQILYRILGGALALLAGAHTLEALDALGRIDQVATGYGDFLFFLPLLVLVLAARLRHVTWDRPLQRPGRISSGARDPLGGTSLLFALLMVPVLHMALYAMNLLDPSIRGLREALVLVWLVGQGSAVLLHQLRLQRRNRELRRAGLASRKELRFLVNYDPVTRLPNRAMMIDQLEKSLARSRRRRSSLAVLVISMQGAESLVEALSRDAAEQVFREMSKRLARVVRQADLLGMASPLEFAIIIESLRKVDDLGLVARKFLDSAQGTYSIDSRQVAVSATVGISVAPQDAHEANTLLRNASAARGHAAPASCHFYSEQMTRIALTRLTLETRLRQALEEGRLTLAYQPKVELASGKIAGFEALARWSDDELGEVSPGRFIPVAEDTGLIVPLGEWALREACRQTVAWRQEGLDGATVAVNLSIRQFESTDLALRVRAILDETGLDAGSLELELTESLAMSELERVRRALDRLDLDGVRLALDDFGTGFSSMSHLARLPFHSLKIDRSFVRHIGSDSKDAMLVSTMVAMARQLGLQVVAEGIETEKQQDFLRHLKCDLGQGYLFSRPAPARSAAELLRSNRLGDGNPPGVPS